MATSLAELRAAADAAVAKAQAGLGPLFQSTVEERLLQCPALFLNDQVPLVRDAAKARLEFLDAEAADTDEATTPAALKRKVDRDMNSLLSKQEEFQERIEEDVNRLRLRGEASEEAVRAILAANAEELRAEITKTVTDTCLALSERVMQLELRVLTGSGMAVEYKPLFEKLGYGADTTLDAFKNDIVSKTELSYASKGLNADDARALAGILSSFGKMVDFNKVDLSGNTIGNVGVTAISQVITTGAFDGLEKLNLSNCGLSFKGLNEFVKQWLDYKTFRLTELKLSGLGFDVSEAFLLLGQCAEAGLLDRLQGPVFPSSQTSGFKRVAANILVQDAYGQSMGKPIFVDPQKNNESTPTTTVYGSNPYRGPSCQLGRSYKHLTGKDSGPLFMLFIPSAVNLVGSKRNDISSNSFNSATEASYRFLVL